MKLGELGLNKRVKFCLKYPFASFSLPFCLPVVDFLTTLLHRLLWLQPDPELATPSTCPYLFEIPALPSIMLEKHSLITLSHNLCELYLYDSSEAACFPNDALSSVWFLVIFGNVTQGSPPASLSWGNIQIVLSVPPMCFHSIWCIFSWTFWEAVKMMPLQCFSWRIKMSHFYKLSTVTKIRKL